MGFSKLNPTGSLLRFSVVVRALKRALFSSLMLGVGLMSAIRGIWLRNRATLVAMFCDLVLSSRLGLRANHGSLVLAL